mmetsp:Transcript_19365/g.46799  ORF Transcript_19365/g.46799 Transcript_19365/m.46799 type:complete len:353 (+) Transcript_19365:111-1169(+)
MAMTEFRCRCRSLRCLPASSLSTTRTTTTRPRPQVMNAAFTTKALVLLLLHHYHQNHNNCVVHAIPRTRLTWVNGIGYRYDHMELEAPFISNYFGGKTVDFFHNPTSMNDDDDVGGYYKDLTQAGTQKLGRITEEVDGLADHLRSAVAAVGKNGRVVHIAHSQGALVTYLAAKQLTPMEMQQIEVIAFGGAAGLRSTPTTPFLRCVNYYALNDPLLFVVPTAEQALRSGLVSDDEFCFLAPRDGDPIKDHHLLGPTYAQALQWEGRRFQQTYQSVPYRTIRFIVLFLRALLQVLLERCLALLKKIDSSTMVPFYNNVVRPTVVVLLTLQKTSTMFLQKERRSEIQHIEQLSI